MANATTAASINKNRTGRRGLDRLAADPRIEFVEVDEDGYWFYTVPGFRTDPETHIGHEDTISDLLRQASGITPCDCDCCR